jgi:hypothetical protein
MGADAQPKHRQADRDLRRRAATRQRVERLLIVCEGSKTEPHYLEEIRQELRLSTTQLRVLPSAIGTDPLSVVSYAEQLFKYGDVNQRIVKKEFDRVIAVFDRDDHQKYFAALDKAVKLDGKLKNNERLSVPFNAIVSVPCFEVWLLLHYENIQAPIHREEVYAKLKTYIKGYDKGQKDLWQITQGLLEVATYHAIKRSEMTTRHNGFEPYTDMHELVARLKSLKHG